MSDQDVVDRILKLHANIAPPDTPICDDVARGERLLWRRRAAAGLAVAAAAVLAVVFMQLTPLGGQISPQPADAPSPTPTPSLMSEKEWTPERIRAEGTAVEPGGRYGVAVSDTQSGLTVTRYVACGGKGCQDASGPGGNAHVALEVTQDGQVALFDARGDDPWVAALDEETVLVQDAVDVSSPIRYRLLKADGTEVTLTRLDSPVAASPDPGLIAIDLWPEWTSGMIPHEILSWVDPELGTIQGVAMPPGISPSHWGPNLSQHLWGIDMCRAIWQGADGDFVRAIVDGCGTGDRYADGVTYIPRDAFPPGWLQPERMAFVEEVEGGNLTLHVTLDGGSTWQTVPHLSTDYMITGALQDLVDAG